LQVGRSAPDAIAKDDNVNVILSTPAVLDYVLPAFKNIVSPQRSPRPPPSSYHPSHPSPHAVHLEPLNLTPKNTKPQTKHAISPDRTSQIPIFTSTPKSRPLKDILPESEQSGISYKLPKLDSDDIPLIPKDLATLFPLSLFRCKSQTRDLTNWERGFWRIDMSSWQEDDKLDFWTKMRRSVEKRRFGWLYILFDVYEDDVLNVFCFGGAAKYVWVLLYIMSTKRTKHNLQFIDSKDEVVIVGTTPQ